MERTVRDEEEKGERNGEGGVEERKGCGGMKG
jgi:hypothetical protein